MQVSGYPSNSQAINISADTMRKEILQIYDLPPLVSKLQNINLVFGKVNAVEYCTTMFDFPKLHELYSILENKEIVDLDLSNEFLQSEVELEEQEEDDDED